MATTFYLLGAALVLLALAISFFGMRNESFPTNAQLRIGVGFVAVVVIATAFLAVETSSDEAQKREDEQNLEASSEAEQEATTDSNATGVPSDSGEPAAPGPRDETGNQAAPPGPPATGKGDPAAGKQVFVDQGCGGCHSLQDASTTGQIGPNLDEALVDKDPGFIQTSIVDPGAEVEEGFSDGIMPVDYADSIPPQDLANLIAYLSSVTSGAAK